MQRKLCPIARANGFFTSLCGSVLFLLDCEQSLFCSKIRRETWKEELKTTSARHRNMRSRETYVARASEDFSLVFWRPCYSRLAASPLAARMSHMPSRSFSLRIFDQKRDCSQSIFLPEGQEVNMTFIYPWQCLEESLVKLSKQLTPIIKTEHNVSTGERQTSWLFTSVAEDLTWVLLHTCPIHPHWFGPQFWVTIHADSKSSYEP